MMRDLWNVLPDDRPVTSICIIEDGAKPPPGYYSVQRTYDQDTDADLWKEGFFGKKITRYLCLSKTEGQQNYIIDSLTVINEKDPPPDGFTVLTHTFDKTQRATKKRHVCYKVCQKDVANEAVTDIIVLSKSKKAPAGFSLAGDMNGFIICYKTGPINSKGLPQSPQTSQNSVNEIPPSYSSHYSNRNTPVPPRPASSSNLPYPVTPLPPLPQSQAQGTPPLYPVEQLQSVTPGSSTRSMAPPPPLDYGMTWHPGLRTSAYQQLQQTSNLIGSPSKQQRYPSTANLGLDGIPFERNFKLQELLNLKSFVVPKLDKKTLEQIDAEYSYDFNVERQALQRLTLTLK